MRVHEYMPMLCMGTAGCYSAVMGLHSYARGNPYGLGTLRLICGSHICASVDQLTYI